MGPRAQLVRALYSNSPLSNHKKSHKKREKSAPRLTWSFEITEVGMLESRTLVRTLKTA